MRNRAKCYKCKSIIESFYQYDYISCECGEISVDGGPEGMRCYAKDFSNFLRVDDKGNEIIVKIKERGMPEDSNKEPEEYTQKPTKKDLIDVLNETIKNIDNLPPQARQSFVTHSDLSSTLTLISSIFRCDCKDEI